MKFFFRPTTPVAVYLKKRCYDIASSLTRDGMIRRLEDGFIVEAVRRGDQLMATVIDTPAFFICTRPLYFKADTRPPYGFVDRPRVAYVPVTPTPDQEVINLATETLKLYQAPYATVVGTPPYVGDMNLGVPTQARASVFGDRACIGILAYVPAATVSGREAAADVTLASFRTPVTSYADYPTEVDTDTRAAWGRVFLAESGVQATMGAETFIDPFTAHLGTSVPIHSFAGFIAAGLRLPPPTEDATPPLACVVATPLYKPVSRPSPTARALSCDLSLLVGMVQVSEPITGATAAAGSLTWSTELYATGRQSIADLGIASDGALVTLVVVSLDRTVVDFAQTYTYNVTRLWFDATGQLGAELLHSEVYPPTVVAGTARELWLDIGEAAGAAYSAVLGLSQSSTTSGTLTGAASIAASKAGSTIVAPLTGWRPFTTVSRGSTSIFGAATGLNNPVRTSVVVDLGDGDIAIVAAPSSQLTSATGTADWTVLVLDAETLEVVEPRGVIASLYWEGGAFAYASQAISLTVVSKQTKDTAGNVVVPAVLLATYTPSGNDAVVRLSTDGGTTWQDMVDLQVAADTFYIGNKLHQVVIGDGL